VDVSLTESALSLALPALQFGLLDGLAPSDVPRRGKGILDGGLPNYRLYACKDGKLLSVGALESHFWDKICKAAGLGPEQLDSVEKAESMFKSRTQREWLDLLLPLDACVEPVLEVQEVLSHPQHEARRAAFPADASKGHIRQLVFGPKLSNHDATLERLPPAPGIGQHTLELLEAIPGITKMELAQLLSEKAIFAESHKGKSTKLGSMKVAVESGKTYFYCTCGLSEKQPFCDGKHKSTLFKPTKVLAEKDGDLFFCACRQSKKGHLCDGSHKRLAASEADKKE
jgi:CDGSH-type Zn-finger protein